MFYYDALCTGDDEDGLEANRGDLFHEMPEHAESSDSMMARVSYTYITGSPRRVFEKICSTPPTRYRTENKTEKSTGIVK